ncbi:hypothetical protein [Anaeromyxobacter diazotrophicus]|uniref:NHL repeat protein n=1 Tax=Anaeromyxobacter diazotrophicus TaxID=2590199 RepID=A0A7I9VKZ3_9BACT|nr:hypothetical protein [Anaeromyxobacter diazotrophicus]GEJ57083.1 hypothetical protein AMYX_18240 [Anaeromyxobacter diazotrophicus]
MKQRVAIAAVLAALAALPQAADAQAIRARYLYSLSTLNGFIPFQGARLSYDARDDELFVLGGGGVRVFNQSGMEVFAFGEDRELGSVLSIAALDDGELMALTADQQLTLVRCNFRGEVLHKVAVTGLPPSLTNFRPGGLRQAQGHLYLCDFGAMKVVVTDLEGRFQQLLDVGPMLEVKNEQQRQDLGFKGFNVDREGNVLFTIQPLFRAFVLSLDGKLRPFGQRGGAPGKFNIVAGIAADEQGRIYVTDLLKSAVLVFDKELRFQREFGYRGPNPENLLAPVDIEAGHGRVFVSQYARRGVSVFQIEDAAQLLN